MIAGYGTVASWTAGNGYPKMVITTCGDVVEGAYCPPQSIDIIGKKAMLELRNALDEALAEETFNELKK